MGGPGMEVFMAMGGGERMVPKTGAAWALVDRMTFHVLPFFPVLTGAPVGPP